MRNKGFTMVELLVVIVIMGLITFLGFPALMRTLTTNSKKEFEVYGDSMIAGAKLYIQKEGYDLQASGKFNTGSITIPLKKLVDDGYISEFTSSKKGHRCDSSNSQSYVRITSETDTNTYTYKYRLVCNDGKKDITLTK
ncbi:MAG: type II secretion system protein [Bacilli bacterium]|nr:type II secretion system protein [Bacilli bacterium]